MRLRGLKIFSTTCSAIELRVNAEDPDNDFRGSKSPGCVTHRDGDCESAAGDRLRDLFCLAGQPAR